MTFPARTRAVLPRVAVLFLLVGAPATSRAQQEDDLPPPAAPPAGLSEDQILAQAKAHFEAGRAAYEAADYPRAVGEFQAAMALRPSPILEYNIGLALEGMGRNRAALKRYRSYLQQKPDAQNRKEVE